MRPGNVIVLLLVSALLLGGLGSALPVQAAPDVPPPTVPPVEAVIQPPPTPPPTGRTAPAATPLAITPPAATPPPTPAPGGPDFSFAVLGGCYPTEPRPVSPVLQRVADDLGQRAPEVVLGTGNYVAGSLDPAVLERQYQWLFWALRPLQATRVVPVAFAPGPRDARSGAAARLFASHFGGLYYSFDRALAHFIVLDTEIPGQEQQITGDQWWWLVSDLYQALGSRYIFVVMGRPLYPVAGGRSTSMDRYPRFRDSLHALFRDCRVSAVFCGGEALYDYQERDGVKYFTTGGAGDELDETAPAGRAFSPLSVGEMCAGRV